MHHDGTASSITIGDSTSDNNRTRLHSTTGRRLKYGTVVARCTDRKELDNPRGLPHLPSTSRRHAKKTPNGLACHMQVPIAGSALSPCLGGDHVQSGWHAHDDASILNSGRPFARSTLRNLGTNIHDTYPILSMQTKSN
ncbi:hypothetical protein CHU98_g9553 [Xylaria longipes]|nr:hypothetical protein CHU98_g9553 [Xylaria longipes]